MLYYKYSDYAVAHMLDVFLKESAPDVFCHHAVKKLYYYDCDNGTEYRKNARSLLSEHGKPDPYR